MSHIKEGQYKQYKQFKKQYLGYYDSDTITVADLWIKVRSFIVHFNPNIYPINGTSKKRVKKLSNSLRASFKELNEKKDIEDTSSIEKKIDEYYKEMYELFKTIFEEDSSEPLSEESPIPPLESEPQNEARRSTPTFQGNIDTTISEKDKEILQYSFLLRRNADISFTLIQHIISIIESYKSFGNKYKKKDREFQYELLFKAIKKALAEYHENKCRGWLLNYSMLNLPPLRQDMQKIVDSWPINQTCEKLSSRIFEAAQTLENEGDLDRFIVYCKNIITPHLMRLRVVSNNILQKEGIYLEL